MKTFDALCHPVSLNAVVQSDVMAYSYTDRSLAGEGIELVKPGRAKMENAPSVYFEPSSVR